MITHLKEGDKAPYFEGTDQNENRITLDDFKGKKLILYFYPQDNTPTCTVEACHFRDNEMFLKSQGFEIVGVSPDDVAKHQKFAAKHQLPFSIIADTTRTIIEAYGVWGEKKFMGRTYDGLHRTTFVIDENGQIDRIVKKVKSKDHVSQLLG
jgi:peroxiredoxin Q/BCP